MGIKEFTYLQDDLGSTIRLLEQGGECQAVYGYDEFGEDTYNTQGKCSHSVIRAIDMIM